MTTTEAKILEIIKNSQKILMFSHIRPDWDAYSALLQAKIILNTTFPEKQVTVAVEKGELLNSDFLPEVGTILKNDASQIITTEAPDCIILIDCPDFTRISFDREKIIATYKTLSIPTIGIDHHTRTNQFDAQVISNHQLSSAAEEVQELFVDTFNFSESPNSLLCLASGLLGDTNNFLFLRASYEKTFAAAIHLLKQGISFAEIDRLQNMYSPYHTLLISEFLRNMVIEKDLTYTYISDEFYTAHPEIPRGRYSETKEIMSLRFIRQVSNNEIVFILYPEDDGYKGSLRGIGDTYDLTKFGPFLNGGGHSSAVGYKLTEQKTISEAIAFTKKVIDEHRDEAKR